MVDRSANTLTLFFSSYISRAWIYDDEYSAARHLSDRVKDMTGLEVDQRTPHGPSSSEAFQIVNYGMGGHYDVHMDPFDVSILPKRYKIKMKFLKCVNSKYQRCKVN